MHSDGHLIALYKQKLQQIVIVLDLAVILPSNAPPARRSVVTQLTLRGILGTSGWIGGPHGVRVSLFSLQMQMSSKSTGN